MSLVHYIGGCNDCGKEWQSRNVMGVAARHAKATGHTTWVELGHSYRFGPNGRLYYRDQNEDAEPTDKGAG